MKNKKIRALIGGIAMTACVAFAAVFGGCISGGRDGINGKDLNIFDIYETTKEQTGNPDLTFEEFLREYLSYNSGDLEEATSLRSSVNRSLMSAVSVRADFSYRSSPDSTFSSNGSGVIIDVDVNKGDMTVVTNCHVVYNTQAVGDYYSDSVYLWLYGSESYYTQVNADNAILAKIIGASKTYDLAVLKVTGSELVKKSKAQKANWSKSEESYLGETVYAIGNPTVGNGSVGMMSANVGYISKDLETVYVSLGDPVPYAYNVMRVSAAINSGNSGGGLYNYAGELAGIVNAKGNADTVGVGYALPASTVKRVVKRMIADYNAGGEEKHDVRVVKSGIEIAVTDSYSTGLNDKGLAEIYEQVTVTGVSYGPALGVIKTGDVVKHIKVMREQGIIEDLDINREHNFTDAMLSVEVGDIVYITVVRGGKELDNPLKIIYSESDYEKFN